MTRNPSTLQLLDDGRQQAVVAERAIADACEKLRRTPIRPQGGERRAPHPPASTSSLTSLARNRSRPLGGAADPAPGMRHGARPSSRSASPSRARTNTSRPAARQLSMTRRGNPPLPAMMPSGACGNPTRAILGERSAIRRRRPRVLASARSREPAVAAGWQIARLESARMNAMMSSTGPIPPNRSAASLTRSFSVPSAENRNW